MFNRLFDSSDFDFGPEPETPLEPPRQPPETLADASLLRLFCVFMTKLLDFIIVVTENSPVSLFYGLAIITTVCLCVLLLYRLKKGRPTKEIMSFLSLFSTQQNLVDLLEIYGEKNKLKSKTTATSARDNVIKFSNCNQNSNEKASKFAQNLRVLVENAFATMVEKDERLKEQFLEGLYDVSANRM